MTEVRAPHHLSEAGEVWTAWLDPAQGREQSGRRPVAVISGLEFNSLQPTLRIVVPLTSRNRSLPFHVQIDPPDGGLRQSSFAICEQPRTISTDRMVKRMGVVGPETLDEIRLWVGQFLETG